MKGLLAILGHPLGHTLSPAMQNAALEALGLDLVYMAFPVAPGGFEAAVRGLAALGAAGANVTAPYKETVLPLCEYLDPAAREIGAVNTLAPAGGGRWSGSNTDAPGLVLALRESGFDPAGARAVVVGAGGAARAAGYALLGAGAAAVTFLARSPDPARAFVERARARFTDRGIDLAESGTDAAARALGSAGLLVNGTPLGANPRDPLPADPALLPDGSFVLDLLYAPRETALLGAARARGLRADNGLRLLLHQGALSLEKWTGRKAPLEAMRRALSGAAGGT